MKTWEFCRVAALLAGGVGAFHVSSTMADTNADLIESALKAAPPAVGATASVATIQSDGSVHVVRRGSGGFTCFPDNPISPGTDPMCLDANAMLWLKAMIAKQPPPEGLVGFGYMLMGGSDASNSDPYAAQPASGHAWVDTGPHVMIMNVPSMLRNYPNQSENPDTSVPYVMWPGSPYAHLMIPVK